MEPIDSADQVAPRFIATPAVFRLDTTLVWQRDTRMLLRVESGAGLKNPAAYPLREVWQPVGGPDSALVRWQADYEGIELRVRLRGGALVGELYSLTDYSQPHVVQRVRGTRIKCEGLAKPSVRGAG